MPLAEAEEGVPFVSVSERELEATEAIPRAASHWGEPGRTEIGMEPERGVEAGSGEPERDRTVAEPERTEALPEAPAAANLGTVELANADTMPEPASATPPTPIRSSRIRAA